MLDEHACKLILGSGGRESPCVYFVDSPEHPFDVEAAAEGLACSVVTAPIANWNDALTPWPAEGLYRGNADFGGGAAETLRDLQERVIPAIEATHGLAPAARAIAGYSLGGLFALYAFAESDYFQAVASMSGSTWYDGWLDYLQQAEMPSGDRFAYLLVGTKEKRAALARLRTVEERTQRTAKLLQAKGIETRYVTSPGAHMDHVTERIAAGLRAADGFVGEAAGGVAS